MTLNNVKLALFLTSSLSIAIGIVFMITMIFSTNGGIVGKPEHSRIADINLYHEGWLETFIFLLIGLYGSYSLNKVLKEDSNVQ